MRELADDLMISEDTNVVVDSRESAMKEAGEIIQSKVCFSSTEISCVMFMNFLQVEIAAEVGELVNNEVLLQEITQQKTTIFKSVGLAIEDLAAAIVLHESKTNA